MKNLKGQIFQRGHKVWAEAANSAVHVMNRCTYTANPSCTRYELWFGKKPVVRYLKAFGSLCYTQIPKVARNKLQPQAQPAIFLGYASNVKGYRVFNLTTQKVEIARNLKIWEGYYGSQYLVNKDNDYVSLDGFIAEANGDLVHSGDEMNAQQRVVEPIMNDPVIPCGDNNVDVEGSNNIEGIVQSSKVEDSSSTSNIETDECPKVSDLQKQLQDSESDASSVSSEETNHSQNSDVHLVNVNGVLVDINQPMLTRARSRALGVQPPNTSLVSIKADKPEKCNPKVRKLKTMETPTTYAQAISSEDSELWKDAIQYEYDALLKAQTWELGELPEGRTPVEHKWIFKIKKNSDGSVEKYRARLVAKGFTQTPGVDYTLTYAPVAGVGTIRVAIACAIERGWLMHQYDVTSAYLNSPLREEVYMSQPIGFVKKGQEHLVCKLKKANYGLKQSARAWNDTFNSGMEKYGLKRCKADSCVYIINLTSGRAYLVVFVDDLFTFEENEAVFKDLQKILLSAFEINV